MKALLLFTSFAVMLSTAAIADTKISIKEAMKDPYGTGTSAAQCMGMHSAISEFIKTQKPAAAEEMAGRSRGWDLAAGFLFAAANVKDPEALTQTVSSLAKTRGLAQLENGLYEEWLKELTDLCVPLADVQTAIVNATRKTANTQN